MEWRHHRMWIVAVLLGTGLVLAWLIATTPVSRQEPPTPDRASTTPDLTGRSIYTNGEYGFVVSYPETATLEERFDPAYHVPAWWRATVDPESPGEELAAIIGYSTQSETRYPRYYHAFVRIGVSADPREVAACEKLTPDRAETALPDATFGGATWRVFSFGDAGMMQYVKGVSYRTVHGNQCFALEKIATGSSYREEPTPEDLSDEVLEEEFRKLDEIVSTFTFVR